MNKRMNYLAILPIWGTIILLAWLFVKTIKQEINRKRFHAYFAGSALVGFVSIMIVILLLNVVGSAFDISDRISQYGPVIAFVAGGYLMNLFTFLLINKKWNRLQSIS